MRTWLFCTTFSSSGWRLCCDWIFYFLWHTSTATLLNRESDLVSPTSTSKERASRERRTPVLNTRTLWAHCSSSRLFCSLVSWFSCSLVSWLLCSFPSRGSRGSNTGGHLSSRSATTSTSTAVEANESSFTSEAASFAAACTCGEIFGFHRASLLRRVPSSSPFLSWFLGWFLGFFFVTIWLFVFSASNASPLPTRASVGPICLVAIIALFVSATQRLRTHHSCTEFLEWTRTDRNTDFCWRLSLQRSWLSSWLLRRWRGDRIRAKGWHI